MAPTEVEEFQRKALVAVSAALLIAGIAIYWSWGLMYDTWYPFTRGNIGIYTIFVPLIVFGILGLLLFGRKPASGS
jgi:hypothetical protein